MADTVSFSYIGLADDTEDLLEGLDRYLQHHRHHIPNGLQVELWNVRAGLAHVQDRAVDMAARGADHGAGW